MSSQQVDKGQVDEERVDKRQVDKGICVANQLKYLLVCSSLVYLSLVCSSLVYSFLVNSSLVCSSHVCSSLVYLFLVCSSLVCSSTKKLRMPRPYALEQKRKVFFYAAVEYNQDDSSQYERYSYGLAHRKLLTEHHRTDAHRRDRFKRAED